MPDTPQIAELRQKLDKTKQTAAEKRAAAKEAAAKKLAAAKKDVAEKLKALKAAEREQIEAIDRRLRRAESRLRGQARRDAARRKFLMGAWALDESERDPGFRADLMKGLDAFLTRPQDRALFDLPPLDCGE